MEESGDGSGSGGLSEIVRRIGRVVWRPRARWVDLRNPTEIFGIKDWIIGDGPPDGAAGVIAQASGDTIIVIVKYVVGERDILPVQLRQ